MAYQRAYRSSLDYSRRYGRNPYVPPARKVDRLIDRMLGDPGLIEPSRVRAPKVNDREVGEYMSEVLAGQRAALDDYVRRSAGAGIKRGGMNVTGGPALDSTLHQNSLSALARGYSDRYRQATDYNKYIRATEAAQQSEKLRNLEDMFGVQDRFLRGRVDWQSRFGDLRIVPSRTTAPGSVKDSSAYDEALKRIMTESAQGQADMDRWRNEMEKQEYAKVQEKERSTEEMWRKLLEKQRFGELAGRAAIGWTGQDDAWMERLGVALGYLKPWTRQLTVKQDR